MSEVVKITGEYEEDTKNTNDKSCYNLAGVSVALNKNYNRTINISKNKRSLLGCFQFFQNFIYISLGGSEFIFADLYQ